MNGKRTAVLTALLALALGRAPVVSGLESKITSLPAGECELSLGKDDTWRTLRIRTHHPDYVPCRITEAQVVALLEKGLPELGRSRVAPAYESIFLGRMIDYPWLCRYLALQAHGDEKWSSEKGRPLEGHINPFVATLLSDDRVLRPFRDAFSRVSYSVTGASVEKVLVKKCKEISFCEGEAMEGLCPYDAQLWLTLERKEDRPPEEPTP